MNLKQILKNLFFAVFIISLLYSAFKTISRYQVADGNMLTSYFPIKPGFSFSINDDPSQIPINEKEITFRLKQYLITPVASFQLKARVLSKHRYYTDKSGVWNAEMDSELFPIDLALGWGPMSDLKNLSRIRIFQTGRFYLWSTTVTDVSIEDIRNHSANMHIMI